MENAAKKSTVIAFTGKGGVGKTSLSALFVRLLSEQYPEKKILAIDADPAIGLSTALGVEVASTVDDIRRLFIDTVQEGDSKAAIEMLGEAKYRLSDSIVESKNVSFLAIGRPESAGCYCKVNAYLKEVISLLADHYDYVVIDGEAGIEQVNRRVMEKVDWLVLVSDASKKGIQVAKTVQEVAKGLTMYRKCGLILNRIPDRNYLQGIDAGGIPILAVIEDDSTISRSDMRGDSVFLLDASSPIYVQAKNALAKLQEE